MKKIVGMRKKIACVLISLTLLTGIAVGCGKDKTKNKSDSNYSESDLNYSESYEKPISDFISALNHNNGKKLVKAMGAESMVDKMKDDIKEFATEFDEEYPQIKNEFEDELGSDVRFVVEFLNDNKCAGYKLDYIKDNWSKYYKEEIEDVRMETCNITLEGGDNSTSREVMFYVLKLENDEYVLIDEMRYADGGGKWQEYEEDGIWKLAYGDIFDFDQLNNYELSRQWLSNGVYTWEEDDMCYDGKAYGEAYGEMIIDYNESFLFEVQYYYNDGTEVRLPTDYGTSGLLVNFYGNDITIQENGDIVFDAFGGVNPGGNRINSSTGKKRMIWYFYGEGDYRLENGASITKLK